MANLHLSDAHTDETNVQGLLTDTPSSPQVELCIEMLREIMRGLRGSSEEWRKLDLTMAQTKVLIRLHGSGAATLKQLAEELQVSAPSMSASVEKLVRSGLVAREEHPEDRRFIIVRLTPEGQTMVDRLQQGRRARMRSVLDRLSPQQLAALEAAITPLWDMLAAESR